MTAVPRTGHRIHRPVGPWRRGPGATARRMPGPRRRHPPAGPADIAAVPDRGPRPHPLL